MPRVLLLAPSQGLSGGIERYLAAVEGSLRSGGAEVHRFDLLTPEVSLTTSTRAEYLLRTLTVARRLGPVGSVVVGHVGLAPVGSAAARLTGARQMPVVFHGNDIWGMRRALQVLVRRDHLLRPVTVSSFSAGALARLGRAAIVPPSIAPAWREMLIAEEARRRPLPSVPTVLTVFRLAEWRSKGLPELVEAVAAVRRVLGPVRLIVAGNGPAPAALHELVATCEDIELHETPDDEALARLYATADLFALCTRTRTRPPFSGEGFGIVLLEAQLAGCAVVGPASGGSHDAYQNRVTGSRPTDESPDALARVLEEMLSDRARLARIGRQAAEWARIRTDPTAYTRLVFSTFTGSPSLSVSGETPAGCGQAAPSRSVHRRPEPVGAGQNMPVSQ